MNPRATSHIVSCSVVLNETAPLAVRSCVTTAKIATTKLETSVVTLSADARKPFLLAVVSGPLDETEVLADETEVLGIAFPPPSDSVRLPSTLIRPGRPVQF
jgi:hypothetical protein